MSTLLGMLASLAAGAILSHGGYRLGRKHGRRWTQVKANVVANAFKAGAIFGLEIAKRQVLNPHRQIEQTELQAGFDAWADAEAAKS